MNHKDKRNTKLRPFFLRLYCDRKAITSVEYGLIAALISAVIITALMTSGSSIKSTLGVISSIF